jgi:hypothetical protein
MRRKKAAWSTFFFFFFHLHLFLSQSQPWMYYQCCANFIFFLNLLSWFWHFILFGGSSCAALRLVLSISNLSVWA